MIYLKLFIPQYVVGYDIDIEFCDDDNHICGSGRTAKVTKLGERRNEFSPFHDEMIEVKYEIVKIANNVRGRRGWINESINIRNVDR